MKSSHSSAKASHYNKEAKNYDEFNEENSKVINQTIENILKSYNVKNVLDLSCGTGSQVFWLTKSGYDVIGVDINPLMLKIAKNKASQEKLPIKFLEGDMRHLYVGKFDAVITIFNAVGHLTNLDFEKAMRNINSNLKSGGLYIFDINNLEYLAKDNNITTLTIDWQKTTGDTKIRDIQYSTINPEGVLTSYTTSYIQKDAETPKVSHHEQTLQIYTALQLKDMLEKNGFQLIAHCSIDGSEFITTETDRILTVAKKL
ncbi:MAG: methyltransferase domain-containing protein [Candidatus Dependentiae bacterium]|nr:methyltransferase domain-containing protein [Candidatus Dependentiae bacterium]